MTGIKLTNLVKPAKRIKRVSHQESFHQRGPKGQLLELQARATKFTTSRVRSVLICNERAKKTAAAIREKASLKCRLGQAQDESVPKGPKRSFQIGRSICRLRLLEETINSVGKLRSQSSQLTTIDVNGAQSALPDRDTINIFSTELL